MPTPKFIEWEFLLSPHPIIWKWYFWETLHVKKQPNRAGCWREMWSHTQCDDVPGPALANPFPECTCCLRRSRKRRRAKELPNRDLSSESNPLRISSHKTQESSYWLERKKNWSSWQSRNNPKEHGQWLMGRTKMTCRRVWLKNGL